MDSPIPLRDILGGSLATKNPGTDFLTSIKYALDTDPEIVSKRRKIEAKLASVGIAEAQKDFKVGTTIYGGIEDVTDDTKGSCFRGRSRRPPRSPRRHPAGAGFGFARCTGRDTALGLRRALHGPRTVRTPHPPAIRSPKAPAIGKRHPPAPP